MTSFVATWRDARILTVRELRGAWSAPTATVSAVLFPVLILLMFHFLLGGAFAVPGGSYLDHLAPGVLTLAMVFGVESTLIAVTGDIASGVLNRLWTMPIPRIAILLARIFTDLIITTFTVFVVVVACWLLGWRPPMSASEVVLTAALLLLLRMALSSAGILFGLLSGKPESVVVAQVLVWPLAFLSSVFLSPATMPSWLAVVAEWNPLSATATAIRELTHTQAWPEAGWAAANSFALAIAWPAVLLAVTLPLALRRAR